MKNNVLAQLASLRTMTGDDLRKMWNDLYKSEPPRANKQYLTKRLAYRIEIYAARARQAPYRQISPPVLHRQRARYR